jgi:predicted Zn-dependent peptidase
MLKTLLVGPESNSVTGRLIRATRDAGMAYSLSCHNEAGFGDGYFAVSATFSAHQESRLVAIVEGELDRLCQGEITPRELEHYRKLYLLNLMLSYESPRAQAYALGRHLFFSRRLDGWERWTEGLEALRVEDLVATANRYFRPEVRAVAIQRPASSPAVSEVAAVERARGSS